MSPQLRITMGLATLALMTEACSANIGPETWSVYPAGISTYDGGTGHSLVVERAFIDPAGVQAHEHAQIGIIFPKKPGFPKIYGPESNLFTP